MRKKKRSWEKNGAADDTRAERKAGEIKRKSVKRITFSRSFRNLRGKKKKKKVKSTLRILPRLPYLTPFPRNKSTFSKPLAKPKTVVG